MSQLPITTTPPTCKRCGGPMLLLDGEWECHNVAPAIAPTPSAQAKCEGDEMSLKVALSFAEEPFRYDTMRCPADTREELYSALAVLAKAYRERTPAPPSAQAKCETSIDLAQQMASAAKELADTPARYLGSCAPSTAAQAREALEAAAYMLRDAQSGFITGTGSDEAWGKTRDKMVATLRSLSVGGGEVASQWVPVTERMPTSEGLYLVSWRRWSTGKPIPTVAVCYFRTEDDFKNYDAWRDLPPPYAAPVSA